MQNSFRSLADNLSRSWAMTTTLLPGMTGADRITHLCLSCPLWLPRHKVCGKRDQDSRGCCGHASVRTVCAFFAAALGKSGTDQRPLISAPLPVRTHVIRCISEHKGDLCYPYLLALRGCLV